MTLFWLLVCCGAVVEGWQSRRMIRVLLVVATIGGSVWEAASLVPVVRNVALREPTVELAQPALEVSDASYLAGVYEMGSEAGSIILRLMFPIAVLSWLVLSDLIPRDGLTLRNTKLGVPAKDRRAEQPPHRGLDR